MHAHSSDLSKPSFYTTVLTLRSSEIFLVRPRALGPGWERELRETADLAAFRGIVSHLLARIRALHIDFVVCCGQPADVNCEIAAFTSMALSNLSNPLTIIYNVCGTPRLRLSMPGVHHGTCPHLPCDSYAVTEVEVLRAVLPLSESTRVREDDMDMNGKTHPMWDR